MLQSPPHLGDITLAGGLATSPAWVLTTCTLLIGVVLGLIRLIAFWRDPRKKGQGESHS